METISLDLVILVNDGVRFAGEMVREEMVVSLMFESVGMVLM